MNEQTLRDFEYFMSWLLVPITVTALLSLGGCLLLWLLTGGD